MQELSELRQRGPSQADKKDSEAPPAIYQWQTTPEEQNVVMGALCYVVYVGLWVGGLLSPLLVLASAYMEYWQFAAFLIQGITVSYLPRWCFPMMPWMQDFFRSVGTKYFKRSSVRM
jgi:hypothetical protein